MQHLQHICSCAAEFAAVPRFSLKKSTKKRPFRYRFGLHVAVRAMEAHKSIRNMLELEQSRFSEIDIVQAVFAELGSINQFQPVNAGHAEGRFEAINAGKTDRTVK